MSSDRTVTSLLVANRGEIARRVFRTARAMGITTVAVYSDPDANASHVRDADYAVALRGVSSAETYLDGAKVIQAALDAGADAVHPGYGFLSENADFARAVVDAGLTWIGPPADAITAMGDKISALTIMEAAGVPTLPRTQTLEEAESIGFPILVKASAGGGGKGMRVVTDAASLPAAVEAAQREASRAFGSDQVYFEKYIGRARHVEIQVLADTTGNARHLFERECSIQRRHQKVVEEAPSPFLTSRMREAMGEAAVAAARAVDYEGAGTVEFIVDEDGSFYFLEMNTRLQVEHPVTELVTGVDLVREQIRIARGEPLIDRDLRIDGAAIEVRLYAEDPRADHLPSSGLITAWDPPRTVRVDAGVGAGETVSVHYDPMMAKIISHGRDRGEAIDRLRRALSDFRVHGLRTNREYLRTILGHPAFRAGETFTSFLDDHGEALAAPTPLRTVQRAAALAAVAGRLDRMREPSPFPAVPPGWRNNRGAGERVDFTVDGDPYAVEFFAADLLGRYECTVNHEDIALFLHHAADGWFDVELDGIRQRLSVASHDQRWWVQDHQHEVELVEEPRFPLPGQEEIAGALIAPMNGTVTAVAVSTGDVVTKGDLLMVLEAMKMEHRIVTPTDGTVTSLPKGVGDAVSADEVLAIVEDPADDTAPVEVDA